MIGDRPSRTYCHKLSIKSSGNLTTGISSEIRVIFDALGSLQFSGKDYLFVLPPPTDAKIYKSNCLYLCQQLSKIHYIDYLYTGVSFRRYGYGQRTRAMSSRPNLKPLVLSLNYFRYKS